LDKDVRTFVPDEVFETLEEARNVIRNLMQSYDDPSGPFVYPILLSENNENIGYVQAVSLNNGVWEIGYHIAKDHTRSGYSTESANAFIPVIMKRLGIFELCGICRADNVASRRVLEKCGFVLQETVNRYYHDERHDVCNYSYCLTT